MHMGMAAYGARRALFTDEYEEPPAIALCVLLKIPTSRGGSGCRVCMSPVLRAGLRCQGELATCGAIPAPTAMAQAAMATEQPHVHRALECALGMPVHFATAALA